MDLMNKVKKMFHRTTNYRCPEEYIKDLEEYCSILKGQNKSLMVELMDLTEDYNRILDD